MRRRTNRVTTRRARTYACLVSAVQPLEPRLCLADVSSAIAVRPGFYFSPPVSSPIGSASLIATGEFTGDKIPDVLAVSGADGSVKLFAGKGNGAFSDAGKPVDAGANVSAIAVGDFNHDGNLDAAFANNSQVGSVTVALGNGDGTFQKSASTFAGGNPVGLAVADLDGDHAPDLAVADAQAWAPPGTLIPVTFGGAVLLNNGDGTFAAARKVPLPDPQTHVAAGDVDGDGSVDLVFAGPFVQSASPVPLTTLMDALNDGTGTSFAAGSFGTFTGKCGGLVAHDLTHDRLADVAALQVYPHTAMVWPTATSWIPGDATIHTYVSGGGGAFKPVAAAAVPIAHPAGLSAADFDRDGRVDFAVAGQDVRPTPMAAVVLGGVAVVRGLPGGQLGFPQVFRSSVAVPQSQAISDLNHDGRPDFLVGNSVGVSALLNLAPPVVVGTLSSVDSLNTLATDLLI